MSTNNTPVITLPPAEHLKIKCAVCDRELPPVDMYSCQRQDCPTQPRVTCEGWDG